MQQYSDLRVASIVHVQRPGAAVVLPVHEPAQAGRGHKTKEDVMGRGILLWLLGIPIPVIILIALLT